MNTNTFVVGLVGMPGSGKSLVVEAAKKLGYEVVTMGDVIRGETAKRGLEPTPSNVGKIMLQLRAEGGAGVVAEKCLLKIEAATGNKVLIDGLRSYSEAEVFMRQLADFLLVAVHSSPKTRFDRLSSRGRSDDPKTYAVFHERDMRELGVGIGHAIALAEYIIINDGSKEELEAKVAETFRRLEKRTK